MMPPANPWKSYKQIATQTAPPGQLVLMLFDGALRSLELALPAFDYSDPGERNTVVHNNLQRAVDIVRELNNALDMDAGGELAVTLRRLYLYFEQRLMESNRHKRRQETDEVIGHLKELRDAWSLMLSGEGLSPTGPNPAGRDFSAHLDLKAA